MDFDKLDSRDPKVKYGFTKALLKTGAETPGLLYDHFDQWTRMLNSDNNIFRWTAIDIIGYLSSVDKEDKTDKLINNLLAFLHCGNLITCNHAISEECKNIAIIIINPIHPSQSLFYKLLYLSITIAFKL